MPVTPWRKVSKALGVRPVVSADIGLRTPMRVERYLFQARRQEIPALPTPPGWVTDYSVSDFAYRVNLAARACIGGSSANSSP